MTTTTIFGQNSTFNAVHVFGLEGGLGRKRGLIIIQKVLYFTIRNHRTKHHCYVFRYVGKGDTIYPFDLYKNVDFKLTSYLKLKGFYMIYFVYIYL